MRFLILVVVCAGIVSSEDEVNNIKKGTFPFMAFVYYPDQIEPIMTKFTRSAVLIRENWLITSSLDSEDTPIAFPEKTLVARLGAVRIDARFTLNEDEDEQEREIIQIARPYTYNVNATEWWNTDISLLKTLLPFNITLAVATISLQSNKFDYGENCFILFYANRNQNTTDDKILMQVAVELLPSSMENCGDNFRNETMICARRTEENNDSVDSDFCQRNSGGPLICNSKFIGIQTYIHNCKEPYLYQHLNAWNDFITCAAEDKCQEEQCANICVNINKDPITKTTPKIIVTEETLFKFVNGYFNESNTEFSAKPTLTSVEDVKEIKNTKTTLTTIVEEEITTKTTMSPSVTLTSSTFEDSSSSISAIEDTSNSSTVFITRTASVTFNSGDNAENEPRDYSEERERKANVEAQQHRLGSHATSNTLSLFSNTMIIFSVILYFV